MSLPKCPVCGEDALRTVDHIGPNGLYYDVDCDACGIRFSHRDFYGINAVEKFFEDACEEDTCVFISDKKCDHQDYWFTHCSKCGHKTNSVLSEKYNFCPGCGRSVSA